jgi:hypothetical protein
MRSMKTTTILLCGLVLFGSGCYTYQWTTPHGTQQVEAPATPVASLFSQHQGRITLEMVDPRITYTFDPGELDAHRQADRAGLHFDRAQLVLHEQMPTGQVIVDFTFTDDQGNTVTVPQVDLMRLIPRIDVNGNAQYAEYLLEEYERMGVSFRLEHGEFRITPSAQASAEAREALGRAYRLGIFNNCLDPGKWEVVLTAEDYSDFGQRLNGDRYINQDRILAHSWFYMHADLYQTLLVQKNPNLEIDPRLALDYMALAEKAKTSDIDFSAFRTLKGQPHDVRVLELGHQSRRPITEPIAEQYYKFGLNLFLNRDQYQTYADISKTPVQLAQFMDRGYYNPEHPKVYNYWFLEKMNDVRIQSIDQPDSDCYVEIEVDGQDLPFKLTFGNLDLALLDEQSFASLRFGVNPYPIGRRHSPVMNTIAYDSDLLPARLKPYMFFTDKQTGKFVNNIDLGVEMVYVGWEDFDNNVLELYFLSYERITPVWTARVQLPDAMVDRIRVRRNMYTY